jgi:hypothetical protein
MASLSFKFSSNFTSPEFVSPEVGAYKGVSDVEVEVGVDVTALTFIKG